MYDAVDVVTTALNAYGLEASEVTNVSDTLFQVIKKGKITGQQLAGSLGMVIGSAAQMNIGLDQVGAAVASLTKVGLGAETSMTALNQVMMSVMKPSADALELMKSIKSVAFSKQGIVQNQV